MTIFKYLLPKKIGPDEFLIFVLGAGLALIVLQGFDSETAPYISAIFLAILGSFSYRWQKEVDRKNEIAAELRNLFAEFAEASNSVYYSQPFIGVDFSEVEKKEFYSIGTKEQHFGIVRDKITLLAPSLVVESVKRHDKAMRTWKIEFTKDGNISIERKAKMNEIINNYHTSYEIALTEMRKCVADKIAG
ncbi:MAG: hypothetical protein L3J33_08360 [Rhodobacteraceae bacterium]|nr:hypothetical protein [Paracoccaceae bacterium]